MCKGMSVDCIHEPIDVTGGGREVEGMSKEELKGKQLYINPRNVLIVELVYQNVQLMQSTKLNKIR